MAHEDLIKEGQGHVKITPMNRRDFLKSAAFATCAFGLGFGTCTITGCSKPWLKETSTDPGKPNILFITADDLGWKDLSCYGNREIRTPNIDRIANEGVRFTDAFVVTSSCAPSRASFITGQYPHTNGVTALTHRYKFKALSPLYTTLPKILSDAGFNTAMERKWHVSPYLPTSWYGYNERLTGILPKGWHSNDTTPTLDFIRKNRNNRFYLEINYMHNHRDDYGEFHFDPDFPVNPEKVHVPDYWTLPNWPEIRLEAAKFYSQTMRMDAMIGEILDELDRLGLTENTMVIFTSDNGPPFPGNKMTLYDRGTGTPLVVRWPKRIKPGQTVNTLINSIDIMPTILDASGIKTPDFIQGISFLSLATGERSGEIHEAIFTEMTYHVHYIPTRAVRTHKWKYIRNYSDIAVGLDQNSHMDWANRLCELPNQPWEKPRVPEELYNLEQDPNEQINLAKDSHYRDVLEFMRSLLDEHMKNTDDPFLGKEFTHDYDPELYKRHTPDERYK